MQVDKKIIAKWEMVIEGLLMTPIRNRFIREHICNYLEWASTNGQDLLMDDILLRIENTSRLEIVGKFYNTIACIIEYKLEDGTYIPISGEFNRPLSNNEMLKIFGIDYLKHYDLETYRDLKIEDIYGRTD